MLVQVSLFVVIFTLDLCIHSFPLLSRYRCMGRSVLTSMYESPGITAEQEEILHMVQPFR